MRSLRRLQRQTLGFRLLSPPERARVWLPPSSRSIVANAAICVAPSPLWQLSSSRIRSWCLPSQARPSQSSMGSPAASCVCCLPCHRGFRSRKRPRCWVSAKRQQKPTCSTFTRRPARPSRPRSCTCSSVPHRPSMQRNRWGGRQEVPLETFSKVVEAVYDCALDHTRWQDTLRLTAELCHAQTCILTVADFAAGRYDLAYKWGHGYTEK